MLQLRREAADILRSIRQGEACILTYRGVPAARLEPLSGDQAPDKDDPIYSLCQHAVDDGDPLSNEEIDEVVYG